MIVSSQSDTKKTAAGKSQASEELKNWLGKDEDETVKLRPGQLREYVGQARVVKQLRLVIESAILREKLPEHILFYGQPGLGKTTLAFLISQELNCNLKVISAPALQKVGDVVSLLVNLESNTVLFIDEIHRLKAPLEETLYTAMEDGQVDILMGKGQGATTMRFDLNPMVIVGATTQLGKLSKPLKDRFPNIFHLEPYSDTDMLALVDRSARILKLNIDEDAKLLLCRRSRGVPRIANNILKRFLDLQTVRKLKIIHKTDAEEFLEELGIHDKGLTRTDLVYLRSLLDGGVSLKTLAGILLEETETLEQVTEPYLIHLGFLEKGSEGRKLTPKGRQYITQHSRLDKTS